MPQRVLQARRLIGLAALCAVLVTGLVVPAPLHAQTQPVPAPAVQVESHGADTVIRFSLPGTELSGSALVAAAAQALPSARFGGYQLPIQYVTLAIPQGTEPAIEIQELAASAADTVLQPAAPEVPAGAGLGSRAAASRRRRSCRAPGVRLSQRRNTRPQRRRDRHQPHLPGKWRDEGRRQPPGAWCPMRRRSRVTWWQRPVTCGSHGRSG